MKQCIFFCVLFVLVTTIISCSIKKGESTDKKPNIIIVIADDAGYIDFGFMGSKDLETPRLDQIAEGGVVFTDAHVSASVCAPSRAGLITGRYQQGFGFEANGTGDKNVGEVGLADDVITIADVLKKNDYRTIAIGKWHLGSNLDDHPNQRGFDDFYGFISGSRSYFPMENPSKKHMLQNNGERVLFDGYMTDVLGNHAVEYIKEHKEDPFLMYLSFNAVHTPMDAKAEHLEKYKDHPRKQLAAMTWSLDENIGKIVDALDANGQLDNTLIFFISDNGGANNNQSSNGPLKGFKGNKFEGGHRVPFIVYWKDKVKGNQTFDGLTSSLDIFSTSLAVASMTDDSLELDGVNLLPYLQGEKKGDPHEQLFWRKLNEAGARIGDHKLVRLEDYGSTLYNLKDDLGEMNDLTNSDIETSKQLNDALINWEKGLMDPIWDEGDWMPVTYHIQQMLMKNKPILYKSPKARKEYLAEQKKLIK